MKMFAWLRESVKTAILGGVQDAIDEMNAINVAPAAEFPRLCVAEPEPAPPKTARRTKK